MDARALLDRIIDSRWFTRLVESKPLRFIDNLIGRLPGTEKVPRT